MIRNVRVLYVIDEIIVHHVQMDIQEILLNFKQTIQKIELININLRNKNEIKSLILHENFIKIQHLDLSCNSIGWYGVKIIFGNS